MTRGPLEGAIQSYLERSSRSFLMAYMLLELGRSRSREKRRFDGTVLIAPSL